MAATQYGVRLLHMGDGEVPGPEVFWMSDWDKWYMLAFQAVLIEGPGVKALVNTGPAADLTAMNEQWATFLGERAAMRREPGQWMPEQLETLGIAPEEITHVLLTPLQTYATANLPLFTAAEIAVTERGWTHFHRTKMHPHDDRWTSISPPVLHWLIDEAWDRLRLLRDEDEIAPGLRTWWSGAHHRASMVVEVDTPAGVVTVTDSYFTRRNLDTDQPIGICENIYEAMAAQERVRRVADIPLTLYDRAQLDDYPDGVVVAAAP